jgi:hypothetical protein
MSTVEIYQREAQARAILGHDTPLEALIVPQFETLHAQSTTWQGIDKDALLNLKRNIERLQGADRRGHWLAELQRIGGSS